MLPRRRAHTAAIALLAGAGVLVAGCGSSSDDGGDRSSTRTTATTATSTTTTTGTATSTTGTATATPSAADRREITALIRRTLTSDAPGHTCRSFTPELVQTIYRTRAACTKAEKPDAKDADIRTVTVGAITGDASNATAMLTAKGGDVQLRGGFGVVQQAGRWQVAQLGTDFLRSLISQGFERANLTEQGFTGAGRACLQKAIAALPEAAVRRVAYAGIAEREGGEKDLLPSILRCQAQDPSGRRKLTDTFVKGVARSAAKDGAPAATVRCVLRRLPGQVQVGDIVQQAIISRGGTGSRASTLRLRQTVATVIRGCSGGSSGGRTT